MIPEICQKCRQQYRGRCYVDLPRLHSQPLEKYNFTFCSRFQPNLEPKVRATQERPEILLTGGRIVGVQCINRLTGAVSYVLEVAFGDAKLVHVNVNSDTYAKISSRAMLEGRGVCELPLKVVLPGKDPIEAIEAREAAEKIKALEDKLKKTEEDLQVSEGAYRREYRLATRLEREVSDLQAKLKQISDLAKK